jgi:cholesterol oxidase
MSSKVAKDIDPATVKRLSGESIDPEQLEVLVRGMLRQAIQILAGSEVEVATKVAGVLFQGVPGSLGDLMRLAGDLLLWALAYGRNDRRTGLLLIMGRDLYRGRLICEKVDGRRELRAQLPSPLVDSLSGVQERVMRDIARRAWNGELRTNPGWTTLGKRVTVHSQGGCPMGEAADTSVTGPDGAVHDCPGLYVMDAAAFPVSVGVNPSATITAIAEFKIERFLTTEWSKRDRDAARWQARDHADAAVWWSSRNRAELDPLNRTDLVTVHAPEAGVVGLEFKEQMKGFFAVADPASTPIDERLRESRTQFTKAENDGIRSGTTVFLKLHATIGDLARLIATTTDGDPAPIALSGAIVLDEATDVLDEQKKKKPPSFEIDAEKSFLQAFVQSPASVPTRYFKYHLEFRDHQGPCLFTGIKILRDEPGFDVWSDTSTLYFEIRGSIGVGPIQRGVARVSLDLFMREQLPSMTVTGTTDPIRRSWALAAYYKHFAGELGAVYGKRAQQFTDMLLKLVAGIHV